MGLGVYYFKGLVPDVPLEEIFKATLPFVGLMPIVVATIVALPGAALFTVRLLLGGK